MNRTKKKPKNPVCVILWNDASYSFEEILLKVKPAPVITYGFIISENKELINICSSADYDKESRNITPMDGFVIPRQAIVNFKKIGNFHGREYKNG